MPSIPSVESPGRGYNSKRIAQTFSIAARAFQILALNSLRAFPERPNVPKSDAMTPEQLAPIRSKMKARIAEIEASLAEDDPESKPVAPDVAIGRLSRLESMQAQQMKLAQQRRQREELEGLHNALERMEKGTYGTCAYCMMPISFERLEAMPDAVVCMSCAR
ncbi:MAG: hypothetical protein CBD18_02625 [Opitutales bacterium TMED158]|nr:MAG: hypothetical protein CBD18_02625 [Opitutales bacterium TMED158]